jgi:hypothetical protein
MRGSMPTRLFREVPSGGRNLGEKHRRHAGGTRRTAVLLSVT